MIAQEAKILDTMLHVASGTLSVLPQGAIARVMFVVQSVINFFIHSGTAQAALTMRSWRPWADLVGITRQTAVYAFQLRKVTMDARRGEDPVGAMGEVVRAADVDPGGAERRPAAASGLAVPLGVILDPVPGPSARPRMITRPRAWPQLP